ncbi:MAG: nucleotidyltransferase family protein [Euryarchaeota archaeon]|nr:nucleotidyltransferase family protein [Euryarchaeota archaeon]MBU4607597.1 nucleotidyltransferase family protein [Euryarchaeota archaeon]MBV1729404.1 nucleotidyltransferase family protein [Methanobacterium sp.]MBV1755114.1 nucleotidyltransferase family protein [Methanobacterium sp.]
MNIKKGQDLNLSLEDVLLLRCACSNLDNQAQREIDFILDNDLDWEHILDMANRHRLMPLLYINLNAVSPFKVPVDVLKDLKTNFHHNARRNLMLTGELIKVMQLLEDNGIKAVSYKGPVLAYSAYGNVGYRQFGDVDILIDEKDALRVLRVMRQTDYELYHTVNIDDSYYLRFVTEHQFINKKNGVFIEIKWRFAGDFFTFPVDSSFLTAEAAKNNCNGFMVNTFSPENELLILAIHAGKHDWSGISWIMDITEYILKHDINWAETIKKSEKLGVKRILLINLYIARDLWELELPVDIINQINSDKAVENISNKIKNRIFQSKDLNIFGKMYSNLQKRDKIMYGIKDSINGLIKPGYYDFTDIPLPKYFFRFYHLLRPFLLLKRYGKNPV